MFRFLCKKLVQNRTSGSTSSHVCFCSLQTQSNISNSTNQQPLTVTYLTNSCGLSLESAISSSKMIRIKSTEKSDSVLELFRTYGFTETQITNLITKYPSLLLANPNKTLKPKIQFFESLGISNPDIRKIVSSNKSILRISLRNKIIPTWDFLKSFVHNNENLIPVLKQFTHVVRSNIQPNILTLRASGVPESNISKLILQQPRKLARKTDLFKEVVRVVEEMGFDPKSRLFVLAICSMCALSKSNWKKKIEALKSFGWSEDDTLLAFKLQPNYMLTSEKKIKKLMDFFVNKLGLKPSDTAKCPNLLLTSLEKRIIPRCSVLQVLISKGFIEKDLNVVWVLNSTKKDFEKKFVIKYRETVPEVVKAYQGEMGFLGLDIAFKGPH